MTAQEEQKKVMDILVAAIREQAGNHGIFPITSVMEDIMKLSADQRTQLIQAVEGKKRHNGWQGHTDMYNHGLDDAIKLIEGKE